MTKLPIVESYWVREDSLLAGEYPGSHHPEATRQRIDAFLEAGVTAFIDLTESHELASYKDILDERAKIHGVEASYRRISIHDFSVPTSETMTVILDAIDDAIDDGKCVYVHCWGGVGRTGMAVGCYLVRHGKTNEQAIGEVNQLYYTRPASIHKLRSPETDEQVEFIRNWWEDPDNLNRNLKKFCEG
ncbi:MAG: dual specificity protein phosphatase family protein [Chloroflexi bacterium]|nr:dual specificity protein phosphatase family protein [Chloroflexota bacterium]